MRKIVFLLAVILGLAGCDSVDCVKSTGPMQSKEFTGLSFTKIRVNKGIALVLKQGAETSVKVISGENLINDIEVNVADSLIMFDDNTSCNWVRDYGQTTVYITAPNITDIFSKTEQSITSDGVLAYNNLHLTAIDSEDGMDGAGTGDFILNIDNENIIVESNTVARFYLSGKAQYLESDFYSGNSTLRAENLLANKVKVFHRGSNDMFVHPLNEIFGEIYNVGDVHAVFRPGIVNVNEHYRGRLIFD